MEEKNSKHYDPDDTQEIELTFLPEDDDVEVVEHNTVEETYGNGRTQGSGDIFISKRDIYQQQQQRYYQPPVIPEKPEKPKKKRSFLKKLIIAFAAIAIAAFALVFAVAVSVDYTKVDLDKNEYISQSELSSSRQVTNILFLGVDDEAGGVSRSDSMILVSVDYKHGKIKLTSFLRDSWVEIPSKGKKAKLNASYAYGGPQLVVDTLEYNFHIDIDHYVMVDFEMFTQIIDELGGVEVDVTEKEAKFIRNTTRHKDMESGKVTLDGAKALVYCRIRKLDSDYMRTARQRKVISALIQKVAKTDIGTLIETVQTVFPLIQTDMNEAELTALAFKGGFGILAFDIQQTRAPIEEHMKASTVNGQWVEILELENVREYLYDFIYTDKIDPDEGNEEE